MFHKLLPTDPNRLTISVHHPNIWLFNGEDEIPKGIDIALLTCNPEIGYAIRQQFYTLAFDHFDDIRICDLGDAMALDKIEISKLASHLLDKKIFLLMVGFSRDIIEAISKEFEQKILPFSIAWIDSRIHEDEIENLSNNIFVKNQSYIGLQRHLISSTILNDPRVLGHTIFLSEFRKSNQVLDAVTRNSELFYFEMNSVRHSDFNPSDNPSGFFAEEIISISKLAGSSDRSLLCAISDWDISDIHSTDYMLISQMCWYMVEGILLKKRDELQRDRQMLHYVVELKNSDTHLDFFKSESSGKWWIKEPGDHDSQINKLIPCTYEEYLKTVQDHLPERLVDLIYH